MSALPGRLSLDVARSLLLKKGRREHGLFLIEGPSLLEEALRARLPLIQVHVTAAARQRDAALLDTVLAAGTPVYEDTDLALARLSDLDTPPGIVAIAPQRPVDLDWLLKGPGPLVLLAGLSDPGNAGTLVRSAEAFGARGVIFGSDGVEPYNPKVVRGAMGSLFRLPHVTAEPARLLEAAAAAGRPIVATARGGVPLDAYTFPAHPVFAIGNERRGVAAWLPSADATIEIPQTGPAESLNAAVAGSIILYEWSRRTRVMPEKA